MGIILRKIRLLNKGILAPLELLSVIRMGIKINNKIVKLNKVKSKRKKVMFKKYNCDF